MLAIIDYGVGNLFSLQCSLKKIGVEAVVTKDADIIKNADRIILPGVGAFGDAAEKLRATGLVDVIKEQAQSGKPFLGICLGMQSPSSIYLKRGQFLSNESAFQPIWGIFNSAGILPSRGITLPLMKPSPSCSPYS